MPMLGEVFGDKAEGEQTEEVREAADREMRIRRTKWGRDHVQFANSKQTICGLPLPIIFLMGRGGLLCVQCRRVQRGQRIRSHRIPKRRVRTGGSRFTLRNNPEAIVKRTDNLHRHDAKRRGRISGFMKWLNPFSRRQR